MQAIEFETHLENGCIQLPSSFEHWQESKQVKVIVLARELNLFAVIDWMRYVTSVERIGMEKGLTKGMELGKELGIQTAEQKTLQRLIQRRFKTLPDWAAERITQASSPQLEQWLDNILDAPNIEAIFTETDSN